MCGDHPEFRLQLQTISVMHMRALKFLACRTAWNSKIGDQRSLLLSILAIER